MFFHDFEAYRRNSMLILYTFYKNFLYVSCQYIFGFFSAFSGQPLYEQIIYQLYNVNMTSLPILWFAVYDFEYEREPHSTGHRGTAAGKRYFMLHPSLYRIGIDNVCFTSAKFMKWIAYALWHAIIIFFCLQYALNQPQTSAGTDG